MHFVFEGRVPEDGVYVEVIDTPITEVVVDSAGSNVPKPQE
jgi:hypothetical protein